MRVTPRTRARPGPAPLGEGMHPYRRKGRLWTCAGALLVAAAASPAPAATSLVDLRAGALQDVLTELARESRADILYSADLVRGRRVPSVKGRLTTEQAVALLLKGSGVGYRVT